VLIIYAPFFGFAAATRRSLTNGGATHERTTEANPTSRCVERRSPPSPRAGILRGKKAPINCHKGVEMIPLLPNCRTRLPAADCRLFNQALALFASASRTAAPALPKRDSLGVMCGSYAPFTIVAVAPGPSSYRCGRPYRGANIASVALDHRCMRPGLSVGADSPAPVDLPSVRGGRGCDGSYPGCGCFCIGRAFSIRSLVQYPGLDGGAICGGESGRVVAF
jgi:hypothetical protein